MNSGAGSSEGEEAEQSSGVQHAQQHHSRSLGLFKQTSNRQPPASPNSPLFPAPFLPCSPLFSALEDGLSGAPKRGNPGVTEAGERDSEEEAGGGAKQAERRGV